MQMGCDGVERGNIEMQAGILKRNGGMHTGGQALQDSLSFVLLI